VVALNPFAAGVGQEKSKENKCGKTPKDWNQETPRRILEGPSEWKLVETNWSFGT